MFTFELSIDDGQYWHTEIAETAAKARYRYWKWLYGEDIICNEFGDFVRWVLCRKVGRAGIHHMFGDLEQFEHMKQMRRLDFIYQGMAVEVSGKPGVIVGANCGANLDVVFDGEWRKSNCHPHYETVYFDRKGNVVADYREKKAV